MILNRPRLTSRRLALFTSFRSRGTPTSWARSEWASCWGVTRDASLLRECCVERIPMTVFGRPVYEYEGGGQLGALELWELWELQGICTGTAITPHCQKDKMLGWRSLALELCQRQRDSSSWRPKSSEMTWNDMKKDLKWSFHFAESDAIGL